MKKIGVIIFAVCVVVGLCIANFFSFGRLSDRPFGLNFNFGSERGSGNIVSEKRSVSGFSSVDVSNAFVVEIVAGKDFSVEVQSDDNIVPLIKTDVSGGTLHIETEKSVSTKNEMTVRITAPEIEKIESSGVAKINASGLTGKSLAISTSGASKIVVAGEAADLSVDVSGASNVDAEKLNAVNARIETSGASKVYVNVSGELHAQASGASHIFYSGEPKTVDVDKSGASSVTKK
jgi:hypothetical protein